MNLSLQALGERLEAIAKALGERAEALEKRASKQESNWDWLVKLIGAFVILGVLGAWIAVSGVLP